VDHSFGHAANKKMAHTPAAVRCHHDQVGVEFVSLIEDTDRGLAAARLVL
jgi:hypothetical protein